MRRRSSFAEIVTVGMVELCQTSYPIVPSTEAIRMLELFPLQHQEFRHQFGIAALPAGHPIFKPGADYQRERDLRRRTLDGDFVDQYIAIPELPERALESLITWCVSQSEHLRSIDSTLVNTELETPSKCSAAATPVQRFDWLVRNLVEDVVILTKQPPHQVIGGCVCFPSGWSIREKLGQPLLDVHDEVPGFTEELWNPTERLFNRMKPDKTVWRTNWGVRPSGALDQSTRFLDDIRQHAAEITSDNALRQCYFRVEFQTLTYLENIGVVFTIRTTQCQLEALAHQQRQLLLGNLESCPESTLRYKGIWPMRIPLRQALTKG
ncbi:heme-dependent oxidative N-demethylase subunit alpha family protein [Rhodopirellula sp. MGV]|uniref:heme-dependent oxidative N-demethylase subunit alpha family protein n=1 Tax=Rhodopirellula sp. MGV TaxID=2023130 RepID=UPI000B9614EA|nr:heme-dependent oxidative N-demethylase subunit alpha family protein [Rhodopirellula sp. MGV]OYP38517.1 hypothetical protein CGZ80_01855 [Rhodopirellula sp. MGV]PNY34839.1 DUF3445 domain-containing protein [Rhodopirellula baltica]